MAEARYWATVKYKNESSSRRVFDKVVPVGKYLEKNRTVVPNPNAQEYLDLMAEWQSIKEDENVEHAELKVDAGHLVDWVDATSNNPAHQIKKVGRQPDPDYEGVERKPIMIQYPVELIRRIDAISSNRTKWIIKALERELEREEASK